MNQGDTLIHIDVQADPLIAIEIRELVRETFAYMPPWKMVGNASFAPSDARFFAFNLSSYDFIWLRENDSYDDTMDEENNYVIRNTADISWLLEFIALNNALLRTPTGLNLSKIKKKLEELDKQYKKKEEYKSSCPNISKDLMDALMAIQLMDMPAGKVFYMDFVNSETEEPEKKSPIFFPEPKLNLPKIEQKIADKLKKELGSLIMEKAKQMYAMSKVNPKFYGKISIPVSEDCCPPLDF